MAFIWFECFEAKEVLPDKKKKDNSAKIFQVLSSGA